jgi:phosphoglycerate dehydrogenase-like enzyme
MLRLTRAQVRRIDQLALEQYAIPGIVLMENAARAAAEMAMQMLLEIARRSSAAAATTAAMDWRSPVTCTIAASMFASCNASSHRNCPPTPQRIGESCRRCG